MKSTALIWIVVTVIVLVPAALFASWVASNQKPDEHYGKFTSSEIMDDPRFGVATISTWDVLRHFDPFSMSEPGALFGTRSLGRHSAEFAKNRRALVLIDVDSLETEILYEEFCEGPVHAIDAVRVVETAGDLVLIRGYVDAHESDWQLFDVRTREFEPLEVRHHLERFGLSGPAYPKIVSPHGDVLVKSKEGDFLLRRASGDWLKLEYSKDFTCVFEGKLYFYAGRGTFAYDMELDQSTRPSQEQMKKVREFRWRKKPAALMTRGPRWTTELNKLEHYVRSPNGEMTSRYLPLRAVDLR